MQIAVYSKEMGKDIVRTSMEYCQRWNCYPAIEHYSEKNELLAALKSQNIESVILESTRQEGAFIVKEIEELDLRVNLIWLSTEELCGEDYQKEIGKRQVFNAILTQKIEDGLAACGVPPSKESLCRVHLKSSHGGY